MTNDELEAVSQMDDKALDTVINLGLKWKARATRAEAHSERLAEALEELLNFVRGAYAVDDYTRRSKAIEHGNIALSHWKGIE